MADPERLLDSADTDAALAEALGAARDAPSPALDLDAGLERLQDAIRDGGGTSGPDAPPDPGSATAGSATAGSATGSSATTWIVGTSVLAALAVGGALITRTPSAPPRLEASTAAVSAALPRVAPAPTPTPTEAPAAEPTAEPAAEPEPAPAAVAAPSATHHAAPAPSASVESAKDRIKREVAQLAAARAALGSDPARALSLAEAGHREFAKGGMLYQEREAIAIMALSRLGNAAARSRGQQFLLRFPRGPAAESVRAAIGVEKK